MSCKASFELICSNLISDSPAMSVLQVKTQAMNMSDLAHLTPVNKSDFDLTAAFEFICLCF